MALTTIDRAEDVCDAYAEHASKHSRLIRGAKDGRVASALMLPFFMLRPPKGFGVIVTTGRKTGKTRRKCVRVIHEGKRAYLVQLRPPKLARERPQSVAGWVWNIRANPNVRLRLPSGTFNGLARELTDPDELVHARTVMTEPVHLFDYGECDLHMRGLPTRAKIKELHAYWFDIGVPLVVELGG
jgi:deazaflavin-dependent oxidoreductase (nitroreductase family)